MMQTGTQSSSSQTSARRSTLVRQSSAVDGTTRLSLDGPETAAGNAMTQPPKPAPRIRRSALAAPGPGFADAVPQALRDWWQGLPRVAAEESAAFLLPDLLPLREQDRVLTVGTDSADIAALLDSRVPMARAPVSLANGVGAEDIQAAPGRLPFAESQFTVLICGHQIRHWTDAELTAFLIDAWRVLTHNGILVLWEVAPSRSARVNAIWGRILGHGGRPVRLRRFAEVGHLGRDAGFAWIQTLALRPFLWPPGPRLSLLMRKEYYDETTIDLGEGETPDPTAPSH